LKTPSLANRGFQSAPGGLWSPIGGSESLGCGRDAGQIAPCHTGGVNLAQT
jgi:hypothetical protein